MKVKNLPKIIGDLNWLEFRELLISQMLSCRTEQEFSKVILNVLASFGTLKQIEQTRKALGIKPLTKEEKERMKDG